MRPGSRAAKMVVWADWTGVFIVSLKNGFIHRPRVSILSRRLVNATAGWTPTTVTPLPGETDITWLITSGEEGGCVFDHSGTFICQQDNSKSYEHILNKCFGQFGHGPRRKWLHLAAIGILLCVLHHFPGLFNINKQGKTDTMQCTFYQQVIKGFWRNLSHRAVDQRTKNQPLRFWWRSSSESVYSTRNEMQRMSYYNESK